ncbi:anaerobic C4-dicarboxylate transporter DcuC [Salinivibrio sp. MA351]|uniref:Anaerobic C4-dicarboxylate transporter DcuC n=1 Tax=Salinivibrio costicola subsp. alcaliphilus TaxID=272773 RepID=A0ABX3KT99_SALCS|nr:MULTISPECIES: anaerobic C4-dicarboxylate transporter DcuC [Salinivibrio]NUY56505.1 anaerobic C4-dicarboxylate transporter DcuC [Salinivibrio sp. EAGSL]OOE93104.1 anaerobic C4-dicarboxylate transporter DcuC [Salinivibrio sp. AR640]OOE97739.1 anaerobic C4-dicarboxylate transporter DcuC [Salinivibrio sp. MA351]OOF02075.1 anaerobic C4-dicarboxylate transporter DcuC [Salinivibrio sp. MA440]OOF03929.1 anaerobic C4-dicarboxylate transporter DcuC [Salinivibrio sp. MA607]
MLELLIGLVVTVAVGYFIVKGYRPASTLLTAGIILLIITGILGHSVLPAKLTSTGNLFTDSLEYVKYMLQYRGGGLGMQIMLLCGFAAYMSHIGANNVVVKQFSKPLSVIKSPYVLLVAAYIVACLMSLAVSSATGLGVLLMATLFPMMTAMGISRPAATAVCASPAAIILSPTSGDVVIAAEKAGLPLHVFAVETVLPVSICAIIVMAAAAYFWNKYLDNKENTPMERVDVSEIETHAPGYYAALPFLPIIGVFLFNGETIPGLYLDIYTIVVLSIFLGALVDFATKRFNGRKTLEDLDACYEGMADAFKGVVMLLVAAGVFAQGLMSIGAIDNLLGLAESAGAGGIALMMLLTLLTVAAAVATGSGNAPFYAFVELAPSLAAKMGLNPAFLIIPMLQASNLGRTISPVSGVIVATSGMAKLSPFEVVKRTSVPVLCGLITVIIGTLVLVPMMA